MPDSPRPTFPMYMPGDPSEHLSDCWGLGLLVDVGRGPQCPVCGMLYRAVGCGGMGLDALRAVQRERLGVPDGMMFDSRLMGGEGNVWR